MSGKSPHPSNPSWVRVKPQTCNRNQLMTPAFNRGLVVLDLAIARLVILSSKIDGM